MTTTPNTPSTKHTPGPWIVQITGGEYESVCAMNPPDTGGTLINVYALDFDTRAANARLIAAAPELLAACQQWITEAEAVASITGFNFDEGSAAWKARAAIARATGTA